MPEISRFYGLIITMFYEDHSPPHFHVRHGNQRAAISIKDVKIIAGELSPTAFQLVQEWATNHRVELLRNWENAGNHAPLDPVEPLP